MTTLSNLENFPYCAGYPDECKQKYIERIKINL